jgi:hypothetical protein
MNNKTPPPHISGTPLEKGRKIQQIIDSIADNEIVITSCKSS